MDLLLFPMTQKWDHRLNETKKKMKSFNRADEKKSAGADF
jgi:hypothetical protein